MNHDVPSPHNQAGSFKTATEQLQINNMPMRDRLSYAWDLLKDVPKSILHSFIEDLFKLKPKEEIKDIIVILNSILSNDKELPIESPDPGESSRNSKKKTPVCRRFTKKHDNNSNKPTPKQGSGIKGSREVSNLYKDLNYWKNVSHSFDIGTTQRLRSRSKTIDAIPGSRLRQRAKTIDGLPRNFNFDSDTEENESIADATDYAYFKVYKRNGENPEYVCCIHGCKNNLKAMPPITLVRHVENNHTEVWDGHCSFCKKIVSPQGNRTFKDCLEHMFDNHLDNLPVLNHADQIQTTSQQHISNKDATCESDELETRKSSMHPEVSSDMSCHDNPIVIKIESLDVFGELLEEELEHNNSSKEATKRRSSETASENVQKRLRFSTESYSPNLNRDSPLGQRMQEPVMRIRESFTEPSKKSQPNPDLNLPLLKERGFCELSGLKMNTNNIQTENKKKKVFRCDICPNPDRTFGTESQLFDHRVRHYDLKPLTCTLCNKTFLNNNTTLDNHQKKEHGGMKCIFDPTQIPAGKPIIYESIPVRPINRKRKEKAKCNKAWSSDVIRNHFIR